MKPRRVFAVWIGVMLALIGTAFARSRRPDVSHVTRLMIPVVRVEHESPNMPLDSVASQMVAHDPFRLTNRPSRVRYGTPARSIAVLASMVREPRPTMTLKAIAGGPPWEALIDGIPGQSRAVLVQSGTVLDRLSIGAITRNGVVVRGFDTTWVLSFASRP